MQTALPLLREELDLLDGPVLPDGQPSWTLHDPQRNQFFRIDWLTFEILRRWSLGEPTAIAESIATATTLAPNSNDVENVVQFLAENQLVQTVAAGSSGKMAERLARMKTGSIKWLIHHYLFFRVPLVRPDAWLNRWKPIADVLFSRWFFLLTLLALTTGLALVFRHFDVFISYLVNTFSLQGFMAYGVAVIFVKILHELGHAFTAKRFGCRIPAMGVAFMVLWPLAYTDTNESWRLTNRWQRLKISSAGIITELTVAAWATLAWALLPDGGLRGAAFILATTSWVATLAINASPFMRFDGYFILCDWLDMPNLHSRSFALARWKLREWLFNLGEPKPEYFSARKQTGLILFAWLTWLYRLTVFLGIAVLVYHFFIKLVGILLFVIEIIWFIALPIYRELLEWKKRWPSIRSQSRSRRRGIRSAALLLFLIAIFFLPWPGRISTSGLLRPVDVWPVFAPTGAKVVEFTLVEGSFVNQGDTLIRLFVPELESRLEVARARLESIRWQAAAASLTADFRGRLQVNQEEWAMAEAEVASLEQDLARYRPSAPFTGRLYDIDPDMREGDWISAKERIGLLTGLGGMQVETYLGEADVRRVNPGDRAFFIADGLEGPMLSLRVSSIDIDASRLLQHGMLSAQAGGDILVRQQDTRLVPETAVYRVTLAVESAADIFSGQIWRGRVVIHADAEAPAARYMRNVLAVLFRETGL